MTMNMIPLSTIAIAFYAGASLLQSLRLCDRVQRAKYGLLLLGFLAVVAHGVLLHRWIDVAGGQNLTLFNMLSIIVWLVSSLVLIIAVFKPIEMLSVFIFPVAVLSILLVLGFPGRFMITANAKPHELVHIVLSIITSAVLSLAGLQAIVLALQEYMVRVRPGARFIRHLPPLVDMEKLLFQTILSGFVLLSLLSVVSVYYFHHILMRNSMIFQKTVLVMWAWVIFATLLLGRALWGWRGRKAVYGTLCGVLLLVFVYFGSQLLF